MFVGEVTASMLPAAETTPNSGIPNAVF